MFGKLLATAVLFSVFAGPAYAVVHVDEASSMRHESVLSPEGTQTGWCAYEYMYFCLRTGRPDKADRFFSVIEARSIYPTPVVSRGLSDA